MRTDLKCILVDDDDFNNVLTSMAIEDALGEVDINAFTRPEDGLEFIQNKNVGNPDHNILFLDINMPKINGWEFLERFEKFSEKVKKRVNIYILSSSIDKRDKEKATSDKNVKGFISKPLTIETILSIAKHEF